jgi:putative endonuclease
MAQYYVYIMTGRSDTLYTGVTNNLERRVYEHKHGLVEGFTEKYNLTTLVYYETTDDVRSAIAREKQIKGMAQEQEGSARRIHESAMERLERGLERPAPDPSLCSG